MIYQSDDYLVKYQDTLGYLIGRATEEKFSYSFIEKSISYSKTFVQFEMSNVTDIAFSSMEKIYFDIFPSYKTNEYEYNPYSIYGWLGYAYINLFLHFKITFETLFIIFPIKEALEKYVVYHEMDITHLFRFIEEKARYSYLDLIMKDREISSATLSKHTGIPFATLQALRYGKRDILKLESFKVLKLSKELNVKMESILSNINLELD